MKYKFETWHLIVGLVLIFIIAQGADNKETFSAQAMCEPGASEWQECNSCGCLSNSIWACTEEACPKNCELWVEGECEETSNLCSDGTELGQCSATQDGYRCNSVPSLYMIGAGENRPQLFEEYSCKGFDWHKLYSWAPNIGNLSKQISAFIILGIVGSFIFLLVKRK